jgi:GH15 family glucan-1,4-alpha-glucosidase
MAWILQPNNLTIPIMNRFRTIEHHIDILKSLRGPRGLFMASRPGVITGYDKAWLRDNVYTSLAFEVIEDRESVRELWRALLDIFLRHEDKIVWATEHRPLETWQYIHARYHPETFDEYWEEWGNKQHDAVGAILFKLGELELQGWGIFRNADDVRIAQKLVDYLANLQYWSDPDSGMWEENEEVHASSLGAVVAGLKKIAKLESIHIDLDMISRGEDALREILPRESHSKFADLSMLSLIYPYNVVEPKVADAILDNIEYHLVRDRGVIRYKTDRYYNKNKDGWSEEAEWIFGFPWLAIIYHRMGHPEKAKNYLEKALDLLDPDTGELPELYYANSAKANENIPLAWSESMLITAMHELNYVAS